MAKPTIVPATKLNQPRWYKGEVFEYKDALMNKGKVVAYFSTIAGRYAGKRTQVRFYKVYENGISVYVDTTMMKIGVAQTIGTPFQLRNSNKREFDKALQAFMKLVS